ncbi:uncharacterized protein VTP21DRAFT_6503 [Calcarisporiella thermophila]|uniref:uncharacterized protein n=1 Tax=Calcarisporiella thermophila TaxID=911321 RepID=UPI003741F15A
MNRRKSPSNRITQKNGKCNGGGGRGPRNAAVTQPAGILVRQWPCPVFAAGHFLAPIHTQLRRKLNGPGSQCFFSPGEGSPATDSHSRHRRVPARPGGRGLRAGGGSANAAWFGLGRPFTPRRLVPGKEEWRRPGNGQHPPIPGRQLQAPAHVR